MVPAGGFHDDRLRAQLSDQCFPDSNASMDHPDHPIDCRLNEWVWLSEDVAEQVWAGAEGLPLAQAPGAPHACFWLNLPADET